ncbi:hypothetical protein QYF61_016249 [Mycteria americana]|uniref:Uncharacterized protein n=1 Tax=Mycteria americana TaxID=33587 RepID=A0AAN7MIR3_MYCAM|nr:hypothetical protein QYF61_016249 [Mycteria americana]
MEDQDSSEYKPRPIIKAEYFEGTLGAGQRYSMQSTPWDALQWARLQEKYSRKPGETETVYLWRVCLSSGDQIMLSGDKANGYWGLGVFLNLGPDPTDEAQSITSRVACWAGGTDALDRGEPSIIPIRSLSELSTAVTKAACTQAMHKHGEPNDTLIPATVEYTMLKPLSRGALAILKPYLIAKQDEIKRDREQNEEFDSDDPHRQLPTRAELMHGYCKS